MRFALGCCLAWRGFVRRWVANPVVTVIAAGLLVGDAMRLPEESIVGGFVHRHVRGWARPTYCFLPEVDVYAVREGGHWRLIDPNVESFDELGSMIDAGENLVWVVGDRYAHTSGLWALTTRVHGWRAEIVWLDGTHPAQPDKNAIRALLVDRGYPWPRYGGASQTTILWPGVAHSAGALLTGAILLVSLVWVPHAPAWIRRQRAGRAIARGLCPVCVYDMRGLTRCPECGWVPEH